MFLLPLSHILHSHFKWIPWIFVCTDLKIQLVFLGCSKLSHNHIMFLFFKACYDLRLEAKRGSGVGLEKNQHSLTRQFASRRALQFPQAMQGNSSQMRVCVCGAGGGGGLLPWGTGRLLLLGVGIASTGKESSEFQGSMSPSLSGSFHFNFQDFILS